MLTRTLNLVRSIDSGSVVGGNLGELVELARLNRVLLGFLRRVGYGGSLRALEESRYRRYVGEVVKALEALRSLDYALFKFRKPVEHVSVDVDILVRSGDVWRAARRLSEAGFKVEVLEPYTVTVVRKGAVVDLYTHPSFAWIVYLDGERLLEEVETVEIGDTGAVARALTPEAEAVVTAAHAIYKEHIYLLSDYYVVKHWVSSRTLDLAQELKAGDALRLAMSLNKQIEEGRVETPVKLGPAQTLRILAGKFSKDPYFRASSVNALKLVPKKRYVQLLIHRIVRRTY